MQIQAKLCQATCEHGNGKTATANRLSVEAASRLLVYRTSTQPASPAWLFLKMAIEALHPKKDELACTTHYWEPQPKILGENCPRLVSKEIGAVGIKYKGIDPSKHTRPQIDAFIAKQGAEGQGFLRRDRTPSCFR